MEDFPSLPAFKINGSECRLCHKDNLCLKGKDFTRLSVEKKVKERIE